MTAHVREKQQAAPDESGIGPWSEELEHLVSGAQCRTRESELAMEIRLEGLRLQEALCARDTVANHFTTACISIREKTAAIERLQYEKGDLEKQLKLLNGRQATFHAPNTTTQIAEDKRKLVTEVAKLAEILRGMQDEIAKVGKAHIPGSARGHRTPLLEAENACQTSKPDWEVSVHRILSLFHESHSLGVLRDATNDGPSLLSPMSPSPAMTWSPRTPQAELATEFHRLTIEDSTRADHTAHAGGPDAMERIRARNATLAALPLPSETPPDILMPIVIPSPFTFQDFLGTTTVESTTSWCPEREEHGYFLTPMYKCHTNPRVTTAHQWTAADIDTKLDKPTECFYNKDGKWYYAGVYKAFWLAQLSTQEWDALSTETAQALIKETLAGRKNTSAQNVYETGQLYAAGALKVGCIGLQCIGFNEGLYVMVMEQAGKCGQTGRWRVGTSCGGHSPGATWTTMTMPLSPNIGSAIATSGARMESKLDHVVDDR
ncbi:hypothetical protein POSPLADRAFT_1160289 [Postia placenta MAD-698-R-SB12]|uniref:DUF6697 domain-containing protein n=1 Tax=Postia placenta MAD-698-R-SB12 TaxID=670580 RepID=A0A1X6MIU8_9APHY|nr:hypothetical protein POSPLADRAFT_1160289 [Postia placenta MAD-698-R-SB12]OSX56290.1 hypothetical protein POSPLADRAFT_1160289 [Postia placenta MAD-698-R-SB12]